MTRFFIFVLNMCFALTSYAIGLGKLRADSYLNQPLSAQIAILDAENTPIGEIKVSQAPLSIYQQAGVSPTNDTVGLRFTVQQDSNQRKYIRVETLRPVNSPAFSFMVQLEASNNVLYRDYTVLLDPAVKLPSISAASKNKSAAKGITKVTKNSALTSRTKQAPTKQTPSKLALVKRETAVWLNEKETAAQQKLNQLRIGTQKLAQESEQTLGAEIASEVKLAFSQHPTAIQKTYQVKPHQDLWQVATQLRPDHSVTPEQTLAAIYVKNPNAFLNQNVNELKKNVVLVVPTLTEIQMISQSEAEALIKGKINKIEVPQKNINTSFVNPSTLSTPSEINNSEISNNPAARLQKIEAGVLMLQKSHENLVQQNANFAKYMQDFLDQHQSLKKVIQDKEARLVMLEKKLISLEEKLQKPAHNPAVVVGKTAPVKVATTNPTPVAPVVPPKAAPAQDSGISLYWYIIGAVIIILIGIRAYIYWRQKQQNTESEALRTENFLNENINKKPSNPAAERMIVEQHAEEQTPMLEITTHEDFEKNDETALQTETEVKEITIEEKNIATHSEPEKNLENENNDNAIAEPEEKNLISNNEVIDEDKPLEFTIDEPQIEIEKNTNKEETKSQNNLTANNSSENNNNGSKDNTADTKPKQDEYTIQFNTAGTATVDEKNQREEKKSTNEFSLEEITADKKATTSSDAPFAEKIALAKTYIDLQMDDSAKELLEEVIAKGDATAKQQAQELLQQMQ